MPEEDKGAALVVRACEWLGEWVQRGAPPWSGPPEVIVRARKVVIALVDGDPIDVEAPAGERYRVRIAPAETPPASLHVEPDTGGADVIATLYVPPSLGSGAAGR